MEIGISHFGALDKNNKTQGKSNGKIPFFCTITQIDNEQININNFYLALNKQKNTIIKFVKYKMDRKFLAEVTKEIISKEFSGEVQGMSLSPSKTKTVLIKYLENKCILEVGPQNIRQSNIEGIIELNESGIMEIPMDEIYGNINWNRSEQEIMFVGLSKPNQYGTQDNIASLYYVNLAEKKPIQIRIPNVQAPTFPILINPTNQGNSKSESILVIAFFEIEFNSLKSGKVLSSKLKIIPYDLNKGHIMENDKFEKDVVHLCPSINSECNKIAYFTFDKKTKQGDEGLINLQFNCNSIEITEGKLSPKEIYVLTIGKEISKDQAIDYFTSKNNGFINEREYVFTYNSETLSYFGVVDIKNAQDQSYQKYFIKVENSGQSFSLITEEFTQTEILKGIEIIWLYKNEFIISGFVGSIKLKIVQLYIKKDDLLNNFNIVHLIKTSKDMTLEKEILKDQMQEAFNLNLSRIKNGDNQKKFPEIILVGKNNTRTEKITQEFKGILQEKLKYQISQFQFNEKINPELIVQKFYVHNHLQEDNILSDLENVSFILFINENSDKSPSNGVIEFINHHECLMKNAFKFVIGEVPEGDNFFLKKNIIKIHDLDSKKSNDSLQIISQIIFNLSNILNLNHEKSISMSKDEKDIIDFFNILCDQDFKFSITLNKKFLSNKLVCVL